MNRDYTERWGFYDYQDIEVTNLTDKELKDLIYQVLSSRENRNMNSND